MLGAIIGDIVGSIYEWNNIKTKDFMLFGDNCSFTDDTVMTCAVAEALMNGTSVAACMQKYGRLYPLAGYGGNFYKWIFSEHPVPYGSFGNGSAMRVSSAGWLYNTLKETLKKAEETAAVTHDHPEGIKGAKAVAHAIYLARNKKSKTEIRKTIQDLYYELSLSIDEIRNSYTFDATCQGSVPQAITAFLESQSFEDAIKNAVSIGGDSDTIAAITGSIAEAYYEIPMKIVQIVLSKYLDKKILDVLQQFSKITGLYKNVDFSSFKASLSDRNIANIDQLNDAVRLMGDLMMAEGSDDEQKKFGFEQYKLAAENGDVKAMFQIADCFNSGKGVRQNVVYATVWLQRAAANGHKEAMEDLEAYSKNPNAKKIYTPFFSDDFFMDSYEKHCFRSVGIFGSTLHDMGFNHFENSDIRYKLQGLSDGMYLVGYEIAHYPADEDGFGEEWVYEYGYYDKNFYPVIPFKYSKAGIFKNGTAVVADSTGSYAINKKGQRV